MDKMSLLYKLATKLEEKGVLYRVEEKNYINHRKARILNEVLEKNGIFGDMDVRTEHINFYVMGMSYAQQRDLDKILDTMEFYRDNTEVLGQDTFTERFDVKITIKNKKK